MLILALRRSRDKTRTGKGTENLAPRRFAKWFVDINGAVNICQNISLEEITIALQSVRS